MMILIFIAPLDGVKFSALEIIIKSLNLSHCKLSFTPYQGFLFDALSSFHANIEEIFSPKLSLMSISDLCRRVFNP